MTTKDEAMRIALEALIETTALCENYKGVEDDDGWKFKEAASVIKQGNETIHALRQALEQPVSFYVYEWVNQSDGIVFRSFRHDEHHMGREPDRTIAFTEPDTGIDRGAWSDVPDATKWVDELRGDEDLEEPPNSTTDVVESTDSLSTLLWRDLKTDRQRADWLRLGMGYQTGVVAAAIQQELAMAYERLVGFQKMHATLEQPEQEPVAWVKQDVCEGQFMPSTMRPRKIWWECEKNIGFPLYTSPPSKPWVSLTDEELSAIWEEFGLELKLVRKVISISIEAKLREKNRG